MGLSWSITSLALRNSHRREYVSFLSQAGTQASVKLATKKGESEETDDEDEGAGGRKDSEDDGAGDNRKQGRSRRKPESNAKV